MIRKIEMIEKQSNIFRLKYDVKQKVIEYLKILITINENQGLYFRQQQEQTIYIQIVQQIKVLLQIKNTQKWNEEQTMKYSRLISQLNQIEQTCLVDYNLMLLKVIGKQKCVKCIYIEDLNIRRDYQLLMQKVV